MYNDVYCYDCKDMICFRCKVTGSHKNHNAEDRSILKMKAIMRLKIFKYANYIIENGR